MWLAGADGCPGGWLVVLRHQQDVEPPLAMVCPRFADILALPQNPIVIAIDIPIGLPERAMIGGRLADIEARRNLGARQSAVFAVPARAAVMQEDYRTACEVASQHSDPPRKISKQCFNIFAKIREVDAAMTPALQRRVVECHPEAAFWAMNGGKALDEPKKVKSRPWPAGLALRRNLLEEAGLPRTFLETTTFRTSLAGPDDLLDACACAWTAARVHARRAIRFPADPPRDARGLLQEIWA
jgi:predicted RNase H-like nuclease